ncbi:MAG: peptide chain release factor aRF-1 [Candidatus Hadarchaeales archaeon]
MTEDAKARYRFRRLLEELKEKKGRGTELITVYIPPDFDLGKIMQQLREEQGTAENIKSKTTRKNVVAALERVIQFLRTYMEKNRKPPPNGMAIFAGNVAGREDYVDIQLYWVEPPEPITVKMYRCDQEFVLKPLEEMLEVKETIGLLLLDGKEATIASMRGKHVEVIKRLTSGIPGKHSKGGQSARRFERLHEIAVQEFYKRVAEAANQAFLQIKDLKTILVAGPGPTKEDFLKEELLHHELSKKIGGVFDVGYTDEEGIKELMGKAGEVLAGMEIIREKELMQKFLEELVGGRGLVTYGEREVKSALEHGAVDTLLISESFRKTKVSVRCAGCGHEFMQSVDNPERYEKMLSTTPCPNCGDFRLSIVGKTDVVQELVNIAEKFDTKVEFISNETDEGRELEMAFGGLAALLRFRLEG